MPETRPLTAGHTVAEWLADPVGGPLLRDLLAAGGTEPDALAPVAGLPLRQLVALSGGALPQEAVDGLVRSAGGDPDADQPTPEAAEQPWVPGRFTDRTVVVTGAAGGIGRATAARLAREGARVVAFDLAAGPLDDLRDDLADAPGEIVPVAGDITVEADIAAVVAAAGGRIDGLANVAGINDDFSPLAQTSDAVWDRVLAINLTGPFRLTRAVLPAMLEAGRGSIVNVASEAGLRGSASGNAYTVSKHGVVGLTRNAAVMYGHRGVRVNAVAPGPVATGIPFPAGVSAEGEERLRTFRAIMPAIATPEQVAASIVWLLGDDAANVNGVVLPSDGGWSAA